MEWEYGARRVGLLHEKASKVRLWVEALEWECGARRVGLLHEKASKVRLWVEGLGVGVRWRMGRPGE